MIWKQLNYEESIVSHTENVITGVLLSVIWCSFDNHFVSPGAYVSYVKYQLLKKYLLYDEMTKNINWQNSTQQTDISTLSFCRL